ncbi:MAG TPA: division plane positioning ATPase MipZ [Alphaproteobacteria bacterium]|nr:division plane positioning ATPase MipZ [Alphaproteobacteria bacterium]
MTELKKPYIIVLGNEKGGTGKSTVAMHLIVSLLRNSYKVATLDVDARQGTLTRYIENRKTRKDSLNENLLLPHHNALFKSTLPVVADANAQEKENFLNVLESCKGYDFFLIDTPGSDTHLSRFVHSYADTLITPLNDSFIDLDMLVRVNSNYTILKPSTYAEMVWDQKKERAMRGQKATDWIVLRNRLGSLYNKNKEEMGKVLQALSKRIGFRSVEGFGERVIFRELFLSGLTLLDMKEANLPMSLSHLAAKQELSNLLKMIQLPIVPNSQAA